MYGALADTYPGDDPRAGEAATEMTHHLTQASQYEKVRETLREWLTALT